MFVQASNQINKTHPRPVFLLRQSTTSTKHPQNIPSHPSVSESTPISRPLPILQSSHPQDFQYQATLRTARQGGVDVSLPTATRKLPASNTPCKSILRCDQVSTYPRSTRRVPQFTPNKQELRQQQPTDVSPANFHTLPHRPTSLPHRRQFGSPTRCLNTSHWSR